MQYCDAIYICDARRKVHACSLDTSGSRTSCLRGGRGTRDTFVSSIHIFVHTRYLRTRQVMTMELSTFLVMAIPSASLAWAISLEISQAVHLNNQSSRSSTEELTSLQSMSSDEQIEKNASVSAAPFAHVCFSRPAQSEPFNVQSCADAVRQLDIRSTVPTFWGYRNSSRDYQACLPQRFMSGDGTCFVEPIFSKYIQIPDVILLLCVHNYVPS